MRDEDREVIEAVNRRRQARRIKRAQSKVLEAERGVKHEKRMIAVGWVVLAAYVVGCEVLKSLMVSNGLGLFWVWVLLAEILFSVLIVIFILDHRKARKRADADLRAAAQELRSEQAR